MRFLIRSTGSGLKAAIAISLLIALALLISAQGERYLRQETERNLVSLIEVISAGIEADYRQAVIDAELIGSRSIITRATERLLAGKREPPDLLASPAQQEIREFFAPLLRYVVYQGFFVIAPDNINLASSRDSNVGVPTLLLDQPALLARAWSGQTLLSSPQWSDVPLPDSEGNAVSDAPTVFALTPLRDTLGNVIALLALRVNPAATLHLTLRSGMTGRTGESYIFNRDGLMLSESRFTADLWKSGRLSIGTPTFRNLVLTAPGSDQLTRMAETATAGVDGVDVDGYPDYRGVQVVGAWRWLGRHDIGVAVEVDAADVYKGVQLLQQAVVGTTIAAIALIIVVVELSNQQKRRLEEQVAHKTAALRTERTKLRSLFAQAPNGLITLDAAGMIRDFSVRASLIFGRAEAEVIGQPLQVLFAEPLPPFEDNPEAENIEINGRHADGQLVPLELSWSGVVTEHGRFRLAIARDISEFKRLEHAMREEIQRREAAESRQRLLLEAAAEGIFGLDNDRRISFINPAGARLLGYSPEELLGRTLIDATGGKQPMCSPECPLVASNRQVDQAQETTLMRRDGTPFEAEFTRAQLLADGQVHGWVVIFSDISARKRAEQSLLLSESVFQHITEGVLVSDRSGRVLRVNRALCDMVGYAEDEIVGQQRPPYRSGEHPPVFYQQMWDTLQTHGLWEGEIWNKRRGGELFPTLQTIVAIRDASGRATQYVSVTRDITEQRRSEQRIHRLAYFDNLTGLPNRELFFDRCKHAIQRAYRQGEMVALLFLDLDRFKNVNDSLGHPVGDELLKAVAERLQNLVRGEDTIARLGGDEFTILLEAIHQIENVEHVAGKVVDALSHPFEIDGQRLHIGTSVGISLYPADGDDATTLVKHADAAMYQAKAAGRNNYQFFSADMSTRSGEQIAMEANLHRAVQQEEFLLHYQPQFGVSGELVGVEALIRWQDPTRGLVPPDRFIPLAEETGLIVMIGEWALRTACRQMRNWHQAGGPPIRVSVNLAGRQIMHGNIVQAVHSVLQETGLPPEYLELEVTETFVMDNADRAFGILSRLRELGVCIAIDDFGTGHSSLANLKRLPADTLKIDRAFVRDIPDDPNDMAIARAILAMGRQLGLKTIAEGVETPAQRAFLAREGCDYFQGFLFARPLPADAIESLWRPTAVSGEDKRTAG